MAEQPARPRQRGGQQRLHPAAVLLAVRAAAPRRSAKPAASSASITIERRVEAVHDVVARPAGSVARDDESPTRSSTSLPIVPKPSPVSNSPSAQPDDAGRCSRQASPTPLGQQAAARAGPGRAGEDAGAEVAPVEHGAATATHGRRRQRAAAAPATTGARRRRASPGTSRSGRASSVPALPTSPMARSDVGDADHRTGDSVRGAGARRQLDRRPGRCR